MYSEQEIIEGFRRGDQWMFRHYFYEYCQYAIYLIEHDWKPLEDRSPKVSLRTWMINDAASDLIKKMRPDRFAGGARKICLIAASSRT